MRVSATALALFFAACSTSPKDSSGGPTLAEDRIVLNEAVSFPSRDGEPVALEPGIYRVEAAERDGLVLAMDDRRLSIAAERFRHDEKLERAEAYVGYQPSSVGVHLIYLQPRGTGWEAVGSPRGVVTRGGWTGSFHKTSTLSDELRRVRATRPVVTVPNAGMTFRVGTRQTIRWSNVGPSVYPVRIDLFRGSTRVAVIADKTPNDGAHECTVPRTEGSDYRVVVSTVSKVMLTQLSTSASSGSFNISAVLEKRWTGGGGSWSDPSKWTPAGVPGEADSVLLPSGSKVAMSSPVRISGPVRIAGDASLSAADLTVSRAGRIRVEAGGSCGLRGTTLVDGLIESHGDLILVVNFEGSLSSGGRARVRDGGRISVFGKLVAPLDSTVTVESGGALECGAGGTIELGGDATISKGANLVVSPGAHILLLKVKLLLPSGITRVSDGKLLISGIATSDGQITLGGNATSVTILGGGALRNGGRMDDTAGGRLDVNTGGTLTNRATGSIAVGSILNIEAGTTTNEGAIQGGQIRVASGGKFANRTDGTSRMSSVQILGDASKVENAGEFSAVTWHQFHGALLDNSGALSILDNGTLVNGRDNEPAILRNRGRITLSAGVTLVNPPGSTLENQGTIVKHATTVVGNSGTITGNPIVEEQ